MLVLASISSRVRRLLPAVLVGSLLGVLPAGPAQAATLPVGFADNLVVPLREPSAVAAVPDGRLLVTSKNGDLHLVNPRTGSVRPVIRLNACTEREQGLTGVAADPGFTTNGFIYLYWSRRNGNLCVNRLARFTMTATGTAELGSELILADNIPSRGAVHNAGAIRIGRDGLLYVTVGDGGCSPVTPAKCGGANDISRRLDYPGGKVFRLTTTGGIPPGNPFVGTPGSVFCTKPGAPRFGVGRCQEAFASGLRNPYRLAYRAATDTFHINDVGQNAREEIDVLRAGADYGWNCFEGSQRNPSAGTDCPSTMGTQYTAPLYDYGRAGGCGSVTAAAFVPETGWPWPGQYLFGDYVCGKISRLEPQPGGGVQVRDVVTGMGADSVVDMVFAPGPGAAPALYYTTFGGDGQLRRIAYFGSTDRQPTAALTAAPTSGEPPLRVALDASGSRDPDADPLTYLWTFGDGSSATTTTPRTSHDYARRGVYSASVRVRDPAGMSSDAATVPISVGDQPPTARLIAPGTSDQFTVGQPLQLRGEGADAEDGALTGTRLSWRVLLHHNAGTPTSHTHPFFSGAGATVTLSGPAPEDLAATGNSYLEVRLTARDSRGQTTTVVRNLRPRQVRVSITSNPSGLRVRVNDADVTTPATMTSWAGYAMRLAAPDQTSGGTPLTLARWSDAGAASHEVRTPDHPVTYSATFWERPARTTIAQRESELSALLGPPTGAGYAVPGGTARNYERGRLYASSAGVYEVHGEILRRYLALGGPGGRLGMPHSDVTAVPGARASAFVKGDLIWSQATAVQEIRGDIRSRYRALGATGGRLGLPTADEAAVSGVAGARVSVFQQGRIYWSSGTGAHGVVGAILDKYLALRGPAGTLGLPLTDEVQVSRGRMSSFAGGRIFSAVGPGPHEVHGPILDAYLSAEVGGPYGPLGFPLTDERFLVSPPGARRNDFEHGTITWTSSGGAVVEYE